MIGIQSKAGRWARSERKGRRRSRGSRWRASGAGTPTRSCAGAASSSRLFCLISDTSRAFFTVDDGKTWFVDSSSNIPPYQKDGKTAYRCSVYDCNGRQFVLEMQRYDEKSAKLLRDAQSAATGDGPSRKSAMASASAQLGLQVKSPGDAEWKSVNDFNAMNKISAAGKCGTAYSTPVIP